MLVIMAEIPSSANHKIKVVFVDDSLVIRERLVTILDELAGVEIVGQADDVAEAIRAIRHSQPGAVILDIRMPGGSGIDVLRTIKQDGAGPMVIILTNYSYPWYRQKCLQAAADFFLDKSAEFDQTPALVERFKLSLNPIQKSEFC